MSKKLNVIKDETGVYVELPREAINFESKDAEIIYDLTLENNSLCKENEKLNNIINELEKYLKDRSEFTNFEFIIDKLNELRGK